jgi:rare lipoprotein A (peptidoglycan hydrolase)
MRRRIAYGLAALFLAAAGLGAGAAGRPNSSEAGISERKLDPTAIPAHHKRLPKPYEVGVASWYGDYFQGKPTASGELFDMHEFTAAHPTLPLGTFVRVTNLRNGRSVILRINDRGPVVDGRIIDVSYSAAKALDFKSRGLQRVRLDLVPTQTVAMSRPSALR